MYTMHLNSILTNPGLDETKTLCNIHFGEASRKTTQKKNQKKACH